MIVCILVQLIHVLKAVSPFTISPYASVLYTYFSYINIHVNIINLCIQESLIVLRDHVYHAGSIAVHVCFQWCLYYSTVVYCTQRALIMQYNFEFSTTYMYVRYNIELSTAI